MIIEGSYNELLYVAEVRVDGEPLDPGPSQKVWNHSPDGFAWGYGGSGPAQLALAILLAAGVPSNAAIALHQRFKAQFIAMLNRVSFRIEVDVIAWAIENSITTAVPTDKEGSER